MSTQTEPAPVYLDYAATTPVRDEVRAVMAPFETERFGNPSSIHRWGRAASAALEEARASVADALGATPSEIYFVRGGTESDNLAVLGACAALAHRTGRTPDLFVSAVEHPAVLEAAAHGQRMGVSRTHSIPVGPDGSLDLSGLTEASSGGPVVASIMWVNNETGIVLPVDGAVREVTGPGVLIHTDASQAVGKVPVDVGETPVDLLTATGHKIHGPKGTGLLFVRRGVAVEPFLHGGGQERALRPGTEDVAGAVGFAEALRLAVSALPAERARLESLRVALEGGVTAALEDVRVNGGLAPRAPHVSSLGFGGIPEPASLVMALDLEGVAVSGGSACSSGSTEGSHVIAALYGNDDSFANVRYSFGLYTTPGDVARAVAATVDVVRRLRGS